MTAVGVEKVRGARESSKSARKRAEIVRTATRIINEKSFALATMGEIAGALDLKDGTLYYYFPGKQALFLAALETSMDRFESFLELAEDEGTSGHEKLERFLDHFVKDAARDGPLLYFGDYFHLEEQERSAVAARAKALTLKLEAILRSGIKDGSIAQCEPRLAVQLLLGTLIWLAKWVPSIEGITADQLLGAIKQSTLVGLSPR